MLRRPPLTTISKIDMTPMAGVLICLLIIFIVMTPMYGCGASYEMPQVSSAWPDAPEAVRETMIIGISGGGRVFFRGVQLEGGIDDLSERLRLHIAENPQVEHIVYLKGDVETRYSVISQIMGLCRRAGVTDIKLIAEARPEPFVL